MKWESGEGCEEERRELTEMKIPLATGLDDREHRDGHRVFYSTPPQTCTHTKAGGREMNEFY